MSIRVFIFLLLAAIAFTPSSLFAQAAEINPYAGFYWPGSNDQVGSFQNNQLLGVRGGGYITKSFELGGTTPGVTISKLAAQIRPQPLRELSGFPQGAVRAHIWE